MSLDFSELVRKARDGDADAFSQLYANVYKELYHIALCNLRNPDDAADAVSDAVLDAFESMKKLRDEKAFKAWIVKILTVKIKNKQKEYIEKRDAPELESVEQEIASENSTNGIEIMEAFAVLEETERLVLSLNAAAGYTSDEIAKMCGTNSSTVRSKLRRAKIKLKQRLISNEKGGERR